jgi:hypothetical protein
MRFQAQPKSHSKRGALRRLPSFVAALVSTSPALAADVTFVGFDNIYWSVPANWSTGALPQVNDNVVIDAKSFGSFVILDIDATIGTLRLRPNKSLYPQAGRRLTVAAGSVANTGAIEFPTGDPATPTELLGSTTDLTLSGAGYVRLRGGARIGGSTRIINLDNRIEGSGLIALNSVGFTNEAAGTITARPGETDGITIDPSSAGMINRGIVQASDGGVLRLSGLGGGSFDNTGGSIRALDGSQVFFSNGAQLVGGSLLTSGSGVARLPQDQSATFESVLNSGNLVLNGSSTLNLAKRFTNTGTITQLSSYLTSINTLGDEVILDGGGIINLGGGYIRGRLVNTDNTIQGSGLIGVFSPGMVNRGVIRADGPSNGFSILSNGTSAFENSGTIQATNRGHIAFNGDLGVTFDNTGGWIESSNGSVIELQHGARIVGGTLATPGGFGFFYIQPTETARLKDVKNLGNIHITDGGGLSVEGIFNNDGYVDLHGSSSQPRFNVYAGTATITGSGGVFMGGTARIGGNGVLVNQGNTIQGDGDVGNNAIGLVNGLDGVIVAATIERTLTIDPGTAGFVNRGLLKVASGATMLLSGNGGGNFDASAGSVSVMSGGRLSIGSGAIVLAGDIDSAGTFEHAGAAAAVRNVTGTGRLDVVANASLVAESIRQVTLTIGAAGSVRLRHGTDAPSSRLGSLAIAGASGAWTAQFDVGDNDLVIDYTGASPLATVADLIKTASAGRSWLGDGLGSSSADASHFALGYAEASSIFASFPATFSDQTVDATSALVKFTRYGDTNLDGRVDIADLGNLATHWQSNSHWLGGDFDYNGFVDVADLALLATNWQVGVDSPARQRTIECALTSLGLPGTSVPEPSAACVVLIAGLAIAHAQTRGARHYLAAHRKGRAW